LFFQYHLSIFTSYKVTFQVTTAYKNITFVELYMTIAMEFNKKDSDCNKLIKNL